MISQLKSALSKYNERYNTSFTISPLYALFPHSPEEYGSFQSWPHGNLPGVYVIFDKGLNILYIGVASILGKRLNQHFCGKSGECVIIEKWKVKPHFIITIPAKEEAPWERLSLEEYLIQELNPSDNIIGKK